MRNRALYRFKKGAFPTCTMSARHIRGVKGREQRGWHPCLEVKMLPRGKSDPVKRNTKGQ